MAPQNHLPLEREDQSLKLCHVTLSPLFRHWLSKKTKKKTPSMAFRPLKRLLWRYAQQPFPENLFPGKHLPVKYQKQGEKPRHPSHQLNRLKTESFKPLKGDERQDPSWVEVERFTPFHSVISPQRDHPPRESREMVYSLFDGEALKASFERVKKGPKVKVYKAQLLERKKLALFYGNLSKRSLEKILRQAALSPGFFHERLLTLLESRLDVILYRSGFFESLGQARQWIRQKSILVNGAPLTISSALLKSGDIVRIDPAAAFQLAQGLVDPLPKTKTQSRERSRDSFQSFESLFRFTVKKGEFFSNSQRRDDSLFSGLKKIESRVETLYPLSWQRRLARLSLPPVKPLHLEICYRQLMIVVLFQPQKILFPTHLSFHLIQRSFHS